MRLHIIRHGDPDYANDSLTPLGHREAVALASRMACLPIAEVFSSPMGRAQQTAGYTAGRLGIFIQTLDWARELSLHGIPDTDAKADPVAIWNLPARQLHACEREPFWKNAPAMPQPALDDAYAAIAQGWNTLLSHCGMVRRAGGAITTDAPLPQTDIALFCHHGLGLTLLSVVLDIPATMLWRTVWLAPTSVTTLLFEEAGGGQVIPRVLCMGDTGHLQASGITDGSTSGLLYNVR